MVMRYGDAYAATKSTINIHIIHFKSSTIQQQQCMDTLGKANEKYTAKQQQQQQQLLI